MIGLRYLNAFGIGNDLIEQLGNAVQHILIDHIDRGFAFGALPPCICLAASVEASMHSAAAVRADDRSVQPEDTLAIIYILLGVFLCFDALHGCILLLSQYRWIAAIAYIAFVLNNSLYA